ncbi:N5-glutamine methyltransferase family protein [Porphyromonas levii]|uniref:N5-glutamine methyltransferase family protein n=1 Tax=Porphyromonas levii TaxID=28114 RepID=UPI001B8BC125|nr:HemK/PrmC family methyltransferase [Porphyromonas levii]MBR8770333.1 Release factor glutamine methyltransferase [Porphyromonas levii]
MSDVQSTKRWLSQELSTYYPEAEAEQIARQLLEEACGKPYPLLVVSDYKVTQKINVLKGWLARLLGHEPIQYVLGHTFFGGMELVVCPGVLIPRPETEELCQLLLERGYLFSGAVTADICTGSGAIAVFMARAGAKVEAVELSPMALEVAKENIIHQGGVVTLREADILHDYTPMYDAYDLVVSNPPYVLERERNEILPHVLEQEPSMALFVPDEDPLLFYRRIKELYHAKVFAFEINPLCVAELQELFADKEVEFIKDFRGNIRFLIVR